MTKDYTPKNTDFVWNGDESKHTEARKMLARKVREKFGTIGDWYTIKGLPTDHDDDEHAQDGRGCGDEAARPQAVRVLPRRAEWVWPAEGRGQDGAADGGCCAGYFV